MTYKVVTGFMSGITDTINLHLFEERVQAYINQGWEPRGGVGTATDKHNDICLTQAMVHK